MRIDLTTGTIHCPRCKRTRTFPTLQRLKQWRRVHLRGCTPPKHLPPAAHRSLPHPATEAQRQESSLT